MALPHGVMRVILLCWVCDDCRKEREKQDVLSHAKCPRCNSNDKEATAYVGLITISDANIVGANGLKGT